MAPKPLISPDRRCVFEPQCTHLTMTRLYDPCLLCLICRRPGPNGWLYLCTQDREDLIEHAVCRGEVASFDVLGQQLSEHLTIRKGSPAARHDRLSLLKEMTPEQMTTYHPDQIATLLRQRENVKDIIQLQRLRSDSTEISSRRTYSTAFEGVPGPFEYRKPWLRTLNEECQYRVCPRCRPALADRAFLSLNAVAEGEIPPTAAVGFGFHTMGERPVFDVESMRDFGLAAQQRPLPPTPKHSSQGRGHFRSSESIRQLFGRSSDHPQTDNSSDDAQDQGSTPGSLKHSPRCGNLGIYTESEDGVGMKTLSSPIRPLPGSPIPTTKMEPPAKTDPDTNKKSSVSDKSSSTTPDILSNRESDAGRRGKGRRPSANVANEDASPPSNQTDPRAETPPRKSTKFASSPLKVGHGVAILEESVQLGVPDVVTHV
ncbi:hypothetical protein GQ602_001758 [Ophiocordyceps camponoti-floridani]|uniref:Uncharacterized protein n=1 Tax=Ophiocordyceps camponoti-floridani TaxID=2030778 RepID=A0A8H4Q926_9HYPO|nr:hypothetical protein GQ602_001758 [Ophiocordyceps camponoti-floridani]